MKKMNSNTLLELLRISSFLLCVFVPRIEARWGQGCSETLSRGGEETSGRWGWAPVGGHGRGSVKYTVSRVALCFVWWAEEGSSERRLWDSPGAKLQWGKVRDSDGLFCAQGPRLLLAVAVGSGNRGLYVAVTTIGMDKSSSALSLYRFVLD